MVVNRANSGVGVADMERTVGMPALALIRSGGLLFVRAANEGRTVIEMFPQGTDHRGLRRPRRRAARDAATATPDAEAGSPDLRGQKESVGVRVG